MAEGRTLTKEAESEETVTKKIMGEKMEDVSAEELHVLHHIIWQNSSEYEQRDATQ